MFAFCIDGIIKRIMSLKKKKSNSGLVVQGLRLCASNTEGVSLIPDWGTKIPLARDQEK